MDRELVLAILALSVGGPAVLAGGAVPAASFTRWLRHSVRASGTNPGAKRRARCAPTSAVERDRWARVWLPLVPTAIVWSALLGWALREPEHSEPVPHALLLAGLPFAVIWFRAGFRAVRSLCLISADFPAATVGLLRPRVVISPRLVAALDPSALAAAREHEDAHVRHRDPLRLWLAQLAADLQWPRPAAHDRFLDWREALELARDREVRDRGIDGADLAAAILQATRLTMPRSTGCAAALAGEGRALKRRVARLLAPLPAGRPALDTSRGIRHALLVVLSASAVWGALCGEAAIRLLLRSVP